MSDRPPELIRSLKACASDQNYILTPEALRDAAGLIEEGVELERTFQLRWDADQRAIKRWSEAHPGNELVMPDHADLVVWLMDECKKLDRDVGVLKTLFRVNMLRLRPETSHEEITESIHRALEKE